MDLEGYEQVILRELPSQIYGIIMEYHTTVISYENSKFIFDSLKKKGYKIKCLIHDPKGFMSLINSLGPRTFSTLFNLIGKDTIIESPTEAIVDKYLKKRLACPHFYLTR
jgi:hypothetical protein